MRVGNKRINSMDVNEFGNYSNVSFAPPLDIFHGVKSFIENYFLPFWIIGVPANILVLIAFSTKGLSQGTSSLLFRILAIFDLYVVFVNVCLFAIPDSLGVMVTKYSSATCKIFVTSMLWARCMSGWALASVTVERAIGLTWPHKVKVLLTRRRIGIVLVIIGILSLAFYSPFFVAIELTILPHGLKICNLHSQLPGYGVKTFPYIDPLLNTMIPFVLILTGNGVIIRALKVSFKMRKESTNYSSKTKSDHIAYMLLTASFTFIILRIPLILQMVMDLAYRSRPLSIGHQVASLLFHITIAADTINHSINMLLYCASGQKFRCVVLGLLTCGKRDNDASDVLSSTTKLTHPGKHQIATVSEISHVSLNPEIDTDIC